MKQYITALLILVFFITIHSVWANSKLNNLKQEHLLNGTQRHLSGRLALRAAGHAGRATVSYMNSKRKHFLAFGEQHRNHPQHIYPSYPSPWHRYRFHHYERRNDDEAEDAETTKKIEGSFHVGVDRSLGCFWDCKSKQSSTTLLYFDKKNGGIKYDFKVDRATTEDKILSSGFDPSRPTILMIHGFRGHGIAHQTWVRDSKELILARRKSNVFFVDWSHHAYTLSYYRAVHRIPEVAEDVLAILTKYHQAFPDFQITKIKVIGHSLGAHVAGLLGQLMKRQLDEITALDPAGFGLDNLANNLKLTRDDAKYVIAYHTSTKYFGTKMSLADRDIFFNDGILQPACETKGVFTETCSHKEAARFNTAYMGRCIMVAYLCPSYESFLAGRCGFCEEDAITCVGVGHEWQYDENEKLANSLIPKHLNKTRHDIPWDIEGARYFTKTSPFSPYCVFTYQIVVKFPDDARLTNEKIEMILTFDSNSGGGLRIMVESRIVLGRKKVFNSDGKGELISGENLFSALGFIQKASNLYDLMPVKFTQAALPKGILEKSSSKSGQSIEVFVNYMSHIRFSERAVHSGPVKVVWMDINSTERKESPPSSRKRRHRVNSPLDGRRDLAKLSSSMATSSRGTKKSEK